MTRIIVSLLLAILVLSFVVQYANAAADHKTFIKCLKKWTPSYIVNAIGQVDIKFLEGEVLSGNISKVYGNDFINVYDCVWNLPNQYPPFVDLNK